MSGGGFGHEGAAFQAETFEVLRLVIGDLVVPAFPEDADPFVGEGTDDGVEALAFFLTLADEGPGPDGVLP